MNNKLYDNYGKFSSGLIVEVKRRYVPTAAVELVAHGSFSCSCSHRSFGSILFQSYASQSCSIYISHLCVLEERDT